MRAILFILICSCLLTLPLWSQAGLGLRQIQYDSPVTGFADEDSTASHFGVAVHYRWFDAAIPYSGNLRDRTQERDNTQDIFNAHQLTLAFHYRLNSRFRFFAALPLAYNQKSSVWEHSLVNDHMVAFQRRITEGIGLGDALIGGHFQILPRAKFPSASLEAGLAAKLPTGLHNGTDIWYNAGPQRSDVIRTVDQAIQPGDGTWGVMMDIKGSWAPWPFLGLYGEGFYLSTPTDLNGVKNFRPFVSALWAEEGDNSATDQYMARGGLSVRAKNSPVVLNTGIRVDGVPVNDLIGSSEGFRRPGYAVSWENSVALESQRFRLYLSLPYIYYQNRDQSNPEKRYERLNGGNRFGDAAFARFMLQLGFQAQL